MGIGIGVGTGVGVGVGAGAGVGANVGVGTAVGVGVGAAAGIGVLVGTKVGAAASSGECVGEDTPSCDAGATVIEGAGGTAGSASPLQPIDSSRIMPNNRGASQNMLAIPTLLFIVLTLQTFHEAA